MNSLDSPTLEAVIAFGYLYVDGLDGDALQLQMLWTSGTLRVGSLTNEQRTKLYDMREHTRGVRIFMKELRKLQAK